jgi:hypothetical protein
VLPEDEGLITEEQSHEGDLKIGGGFNLYSSEGPLSSDESPPASQSRMVYAPTAKGKWKQAETKGIPPEAVSSAYSRKVSWRGAAEDRSNPRWTRGSVGYEEDPMDTAAQQALFECMARDPDTVQQALEAFERDLPAPGTEADESVRQGSEGGFRHWLSEVDVSGSCACFLDVLEKNYDNPSRSSTSTSTICSLKRLSPTSC